MNPLLDLDARPGHRPPRRLGLRAGEHAARPSSWRVEQGADAFELDVRLTPRRRAGRDPRRDARPHHRPGRRGPRAGRWPSCARRTRATASRPTAAAPSRSAAPGVRIPTLGEVLWAFPRMPVLIEVKEPEVQEAVRRVLVRRARRSAAWWPPSTSGRSSCSASRRSRAAPRAPEISALYRGGAAPPPAAASAATGCCRCRSGIAGSRCRPAGSCAAARRLGCPVHVWTVNDAATARRLWARGVAGIVTNVPDVIRAARDRYFDLEVGGQQAAVQRGHGRPIAGAGRLRCLPVLHELASGVPQLRAAGGGDLDRVLGPGRAAGRRRRGKGLHGPDVGPLDGAHVDLEFERHGQPPFTVFHTMLPVGMSTG